MATSLPKTCKINPLIIGKRLQTDLILKKLETFDKI